MRTYELIIKENYDDNSTVAVRATVVMLSDLSDEQAKYLSSEGNDLKDLPVDMAARLTCYQQELDRMKGDLLSFIRSYLDKHLTEKLNLGVILSLVNEEMMSIVKTGDSYLLETINEAGVEWPYDLCNPENFKMQDLLWIANHLVKKRE